MSLLMGGKFGSILRWMVVHWDTTLLIVANILMMCGYLYVPVGIYAVILFHNVVRPLWRCFIYTKPIWFLRYKMRPIWRRLHWMFGKKYYWVYRGGIVKVVVTERDPGHKMLSLMEYRTWDDGSKCLNRFSTGTDCTFRKLEDAIKYLVRIHKQEFDRMDEYWHEREAKNRSN